MLLEFQHEVVKDATLTFAHILKSEVPEHLESHKPLEVCFDIPSDEYIARVRADGKLLVSLLLIDVPRSQIKPHSQASIERREDENGEICEYAVGPATFVTPRYLMTSWAADPLVDHEVIGCIMRVFFDTPSFPAQYIQGRSITGDNDLEIAMVDGFGLERQMALWQVMGKPFRLSVAYSVNLRMASLKKTIVRRVRERVLDFKKLEG